MKNSLKIVILILALLLTGCEKNRYVVTFVDEEGKIIFTETVNSGEAASAPEVRDLPEGKMIIWSQPFDCITCDMIIIGTIIPDDLKYTVTYEDIDGKILKTEVVARNGQAEGLVLPDRNGYKFKGWSRDLTQVTCDLEVYPLYEEAVKLYKIVFDGQGGTILDGSPEQYVEEGKMPVIPRFYKEMYEFAGYDQEVGIATADCTYHAQYKELTIEKIPSSELVKRITFGWNYVNGMNETNDDDKIIDLLLEKNINTVQLPITWIAQCDENYVINEDYLTKTRQFVDKATKKGMYVVLCSYDAYEYEWSSLNYDNFDKLVRVMTVQWTQLGEMFKDYDEHVLFSFLGEPRDYTDNLLDKEAYHILNDVNQMFVDLIRRQGGNNTYRHLIITTGWGKISDGSYDYFRMVDDDYVIVGVHSYTPFGFTHDQTLDETSWDQECAEYQIAILMEMQKANDHYIKKGIPVLMTEFGSRDKGNDEERAKWLEYYVSCAYAYGIKCFVWDCAKVHLEREYTFGLINRETYQWAFPALTDKLSDMLVNQNYLNFYLEARNMVYKLSEEIIIPTQLTDLVTKEKVMGEASYDVNFFDTIDGKLYAKQCGKTIVSLTVNDYVYYYQIEVYPDYQIIDTQFTLRIGTNDTGDTQCYIETLGYSYMRVDYDWYSSDDSILSINQYSTITIKKDGVVGIIAINKESGAIGVVEVDIKNYTIVSFHSEIQTIQD